MFWHKQALLLFLLSSWCLGEVHLLRFPMGTAENGPFFPMFMHKDGGVLLMLAIRKHKQENALS